MSEFLYDKNSILITATLFLSMAVIIEIGFRLGRRFERASNEATKGHVSSLQNALLGILALLLGFTFSLALQRYDSRSEAVVKEANAIGTTLLRAELLPKSVRDDVVRELRTHVDIRVAESVTSTTDEAKRLDLQSRTNEQFTILWALATKAAAEEPNPVTTGLFIQSLNDMIDSYGSREAQLNRHVPEVVLLLLFCTFLMTGCIVGFTAGLAGRRDSFVTYVMVGLIVLLVFIIIDLDRPRRGWIRVSQKSMTDLQQSVHPPAKDPGR